MSCLGLCLKVGPPVNKRLALSAISLEAGKLGATTDHLHLSLVGSWTSALLCRRPLMVCLDKSFSLVDAVAVNANESKVILLGRAALTELSLLAS